MKQFILLGFALLITQFSSAQSGTKNFIDQNYIEVNGTAKMEIVPDEIYLNITLNERDTRNKKSIDQLEKKMFTILKKVGIDLKKQVSVLDFTSDFKTYFLKRKDVLKSKSFQVLVHNTEMLSKLFPALEKIDISNIQIVKVDHSKMDQFKKEVKIKAIKDAKTNAKTLAEAIGQEIGKAIYIGQGYSNQFDSQPRAKSMMMRGMNEMADQEMVPILEFKKIKIEHNLMVRFELK